MSSFVLFSIASVQKTTFVNFTEEYGLDGNTLVPKLPARCLKFMNIDRAIIITR